MASPAHPPSVICFGQFELDAANGELRKSGIPLKIHPQPFRVLLLLAERPRQIVTRDEIQRFLWGDNTFVDFERGINSCVNQIRAVLGDDPETPRYVETIPRRGYRFIAPATNNLGTEPAVAVVSSASMALPRPSSGGLAPAAHPAATLHVVTQQAARVPGSDPTQKRMLAVACSFLVLLVAGTIWRVKRQSSSSSGLPDLKQLQITANSSENEVTSGAISPDGKYLAYADTKGIHIKLIKTGDTQDVSQPKNLAGMQVNWSIAPNWARDGSRIIATANIPGQPPSIWAVPVMGGAPRKIRDNASARSVSRDGSWVAFTTNLGRMGDDREIWMMTPNGERARKLYEADDNGSFAEPEWSPDGQRLAYVWHHEEGDNVKLVVENRDLNAGPAAMVLPTWTWDLRWSPDGRLIYSLNDPGPIGASCSFWGMHLDGRTGNPMEAPKRLTDGADFCMDSLSLSEDGRRLAFRKWALQGNVFVADLDASGAHISVPQRLTLSEGRNYPAAWTPDGKSVIFGAYRDGQWSLFKQALGTDNALFIATVADSKNLSDYGLDDAWSASARVSPDGAWLLYLSAPQETGSSSPFLAPARLMRVPITGGAAELVLTARTNHRPACARSPVMWCVIAEQSPDRKQLLFTSFEPSKGRIQELLRFNIDVHARYPNDYLWDLSPDGASIAVLRRSEPTIQLLSVTGAASRVIVVKGWNNLQSMNWAADGKGLIVSSTTADGEAMLHVDLQGIAKVLWEEKGSLDPTTGLDAPWGLPSPDGRHLAIYVGSLSSNMWMIENF